MSPKEDDKGDIESKISFDVDIRLIFNGKVLLNKESAGLLYFIEKKRSIISAAKAIGIPYTRAWVIIDRIERILGKRIIIRSKGGFRRGFSVLTETGRRILGIYLTRMRELGLSFWIEKAEKSEGNNFIVVGSDDPLLRVLLEAYSSRYRRTTDYYALGSMIGLMHGFFGDVNLIGVHLYDPESKTYNIAQIRSMGLQGLVALFRGYRRNIVIAWRPNIETPPSTLEECIKRNFTIATRGEGSGTYHWLRKMLPQESIPKILKLRTHRQVAKAVKESKADIGITIEFEAHRFSLPYKRIWTEYFDFVVPLNKLDDSKEFLEFLRESKEKIDSTVGYEVPPDFLERLL